MHAGGLYEGGSEDRRKQEARGQGRLRQGLDGRVDGKADKLQRFIPRALVLGCRGCRTKRRLGVSAAVGCLLTGRERVGRIVGRCTTRGPLSGLC